MKPPHPTSSSTSMTLYSKAAPKCISGSTSYLPSLIGLSPLPTSHPKTFFNIWLVRSSISMLQQTSTCSWVDHAGFASAPTDYSALLRLAFATPSNLKFLKLAREKQLVGSLCKRHAVIPSKWTPTACKRTVSGSISLPLLRRTFHLSLTVLVHYRSLRSI